MEKVSDTQKQVISIAHRHRKFRKGVNRMKPLSVKFGVILAIVGFSIFASAEVWGDDWVFYGGSSKER
jgi:hypothetical protein